MRQPKERLYVGSRFEDEMADMLDRSILDAPAFTRDVLQDIPAVKRRIEKFEEERAKKMEIDCQNR